MARPLKFKDGPLNTDLRISVTKEQKLLIQEAVGLDGLDIAVWCRNLLLDAARTRVERAATDGSKRSHGAGE